MAVKQESRPEAEPSGRARWSKREAKAFMASRPKRTVFVERTQDDQKYEEANNGQPVYQYVGWNGWAYPIPKGRPVEVPDVIADIIEQSQQRLRTAQARDGAAFFNEISGGGLGTKLVGDDPAPGAGWPGR